MVYFFLNNILLGAHSTFKIRIRWYLEHHPKIICMKRYGQRLQNPGYCAQADESTYFYRRI